MRKVRLAIACDERWDAMRRVEGGRFCDRCEKRVVDFTSMTEREAVIVASLFAPGSLCGRLPRVRDGIPRFREERRPPSRVPLMLMTAALAAGCSAPAAVATADPATTTAKAPAKSSNADSDNDGVLDSNDKCPSEPEDKDGFEDEDGCPDPDNDKDRIPDAKDQCPNEPETYNGLNDEDGCPDKGGVIVLDSPVSIHEIVAFDANSDALGAASNTVLDAVAKTFKANPSLGTIVVKGHSLPTEKDAEKLAERRAKQVVDALVKRGVDKLMLDLRAMKPEAQAKTEPTGYGRRVDFEVASKASCPPP